MQCIKSKILHYVEDIIERFIWGQVHGSSCLFSHQFSLHLRDNSTKMTRKIYHVLHSAPSDNYYLFNCALGVIVQLIFFKFKFYRLVSIYFYSFWQQRFFCLFSNDLWKIRCLRFHLMCKPVTFEINGFHFCLEFPWFYWYWPKILWCHYFLAIFLIKSFTS